MTIGELAGLIAAIAFVILVIFSFISLSVPQHEFQIIQQSLDSSITARLDA